MLNDVQAFAHTSPGPYVKFGEKRLASQEDIRFWIDTWIDRLIAQVTSAAVRGTGAEAGSDRPVSPRAGDVVGWKSSSIPRKTTVPNRPLRFPNS